MVNIKQRHLEKLLIESVRYCLGRMTYAVSECSQIVRIHWQDIGDRAKSVIKKDIQGLIQQHTDFIHNEKYQQQISVDGYSYLGMECDAFTWIDLLNWIEEQEEENEKKLNSVYRHSQMKFYAGYVNKKGDLWTEKQDVTMPALFCVVQHCLKFGSPIIISKENGEPEFEITVKDLRNAANN